MIRQGRFQRNPDRRVFGGKYMKVIHEIILQNAGDDLIAKTDFSLGVLFAQDRRLRSESVHNALLDLSA